MMSQISPKVNVEDEMRQSYLDYAMSVIIGRALPDVRDGLKPVQRRVLYAMLLAGLSPEKKHSKCAGVVGGVLQAFHPHGDAPVYEALVRLTQPWALRYPLIDGQGNFGSVDGDPAAAYRYTECRLSRVGEQLLEDIEKETVDFIPNFDDTRVEPVVLPSVVPALLVNGADGIAVGMATHIPPHNLTEVISGALALIENPTITVRELMEFIPGPDFPTGGMICGRNEIAQAYETGRGIIQLRGKLETEELKGKSRDTIAIVITEIPFQVNKAKLVEKIAELGALKEIDGISKVRDESDRSGMRIVIELKRDATPEVVINQLYKLTPLQESFGIISLAIVDGVPTVCTLKQLLTHFVNHRRDVIVRRTSFELRQADARMHLLEGFKIALLNLDDVIALIKGSETPQIAKDELCRRYSLSEIQAQAILDLRLQRLTGMERIAIEREHAELAAELARLRSILSDAKKVDAIISGELRNIKEKYGDERRTQIIGEVTNINMEDLMEDEEMVVTISHAGYAKRTPVTLYRSQKRGGKGVAGAASKDEDFVEHLFVASNLAYLLVFTDLGRLYWLKVYEIPEASRAARGRALINMVALAQDEKVTAILPVREFDQNRFVVMATQRGVIKKVDLQHFSNPRRGGLIAVSLDEGDHLIGVRITEGNDDVLLATKDGMSIRFAETDVRAMGRTARGVTGMKLSENDQVVGMTAVRQNAPENLSLLTVCESGYGKRTAMSEYRIQGRAGSGIIDIKTNERNGAVISVNAVESGTEVMIITSGSKIIRTSIDNISLIGRNTQGVRLIDLDEGEKVVACTPVLEKDEETDVVQ